MSNLKAQFSPSKVAFYPQNMIDDGSYGESLPNDIIELSDDELTTYWKKTPPVGMMMGQIDGRPGWVPLPEQTKEEKIAAAEAERAYRKNQVVQAISVYQMKLQLGRKLTSAETKFLNAWLDYSDELEVVDAENPIWPEIPS